MSFKTLFSLKITVAISKIVFLHLMNHISFHGFRPTNARLVIHFLQNAEYSMVIRLPNLIRMENGCAL